MYRIFQDHEMMTRIMMRSSLALMLVMYCGVQVPARDPGQQLFDLNNHQIDSLLTVTAAKNLTITERMNFYSQMFLGMPCTGDGPYALLETQPLVNFEETNCMVFTEHLLALSISDSWDNFFNNLQQIRYQDGMIGMRTRNHYTMADWLPENRWLLDDVSDKVGENFTRQVTRTISHITFFQKKGITDLRYVKPDRRVTISYIPSENLDDIKRKLKVGDIGALIYAEKTDIFSAHMWLVAETNGQVVIRESSNSRMTTFETPYAEWSTRIRSSAKYIGIAVMRVRGQLNQPGKIILPWEIDSLKTVH
jgi:hypothetical protein